MLHKLKSKLIFIYSYSFFQSSENKVYLKRKLFYQTAKSSTHVRYQYIREDFHVKIYSFFHLPVVTGSERSVLLVAYITDGTLRPW